MERLPYSVTGALCVVGIALNGIKKWVFKRLEPMDFAARRQILAATDERDIAIFDHEERAGSDDS